MCRPGIAVTLLAASQAACAPQGHVNAQAPTLASYLLSPRMTSGAM